MPKTEPQGRPTDGKASERETVMFTLSPQFLESLDKFSGALNESRSATIRRLVAEGIGYNLDAEPKTNKARKYANAEERKAATLARAKARRQITKQLLDAYNSKDKELAIQALLDSLKQEASQDLGSLLNEVK